MSTFLFIDSIITAADEFITDLVTLDAVLLQLFVFALLLGGVYTLTALGLNLIFGVMEVVNFAHGMLVGLGMYTIWLVSSTFNLHPFLVFPAVLVVSFVFGVMMNVSTIDPIIEEPEENQFVVTFGWTFILLAGFQILFSPNPHTLDINFGKAEVYGAFIPYGQLYALAIAIVTVAVVWLFLQRTEMGLAIRATANNRDSAHYVGIRVSRIDNITFGIGSLLAGIGGAAIAMTQTFDPFILETYLVYAFVIVILGGLGSFPGALVGAMVIAFVKTFGGYYLPGTTFQIAIFGIFLMMLYLKPEGLFGEGIQS